MSSHILTQGWVGSGDTYADIFIMMKHICLSEHPPLSTYPWSAITFYSCVAFHREVRDTVFGAVKFDTFDTYKVVY